jgi:predicted HTH transcriptional regulator
MNASGGALLVGVSDSGAITGVEPDYPFVKKPDEDGWGLWFTDLMTKSLGQALAADVGLQFVRLDDHIVGRIDVPAGSSPVFAKRAKGDAKDVYLVRINNSTQELTGPELLAHQKQRWGH